jgi:hypothetical protein
MTQERKVPGRKKRVGDIIPVWKQRAAIEALIRVRLDRKWTLNACVMALQEARYNVERLCNEDREKKDEFVKLHPEFDADDNTISRALKGHIPYNELVNAIYLWMATMHKSFYKPLEAEEYARENETGVSETRLLLGHDRTLNLNKAQDLAGTYKLYRPSHNDPKNTIIVSKLIIGHDAIAGENHDKSYFNCSYESEYSQDDKVTTTLATGKIVPHGQRVLALLTTLRKGNFVILFDRIYGDTDSSLFQSLGGIMIAAIIDGPASAWPIYALRVDDPKAEFEFTDYHATDLKNLPRGVWDRLRRGAIYWADETFPGFGFFEATANQ